MRGFVFIDEVVPRARRYLRTSTDMHASLLLLKKMQQSVLKKWRTNAVTGMGTSCTQRLAESAGSSTVAVLLFQALGDADGPTVGSIDGRGERNAFARDTRRQTRVRWSALRAARATCAYACVVQATRVAMRAMARSWPHSCARVWWLFKCPAPRI